MNRQILEPSEDLKPFVECYWVLESSREKFPKRNTIVPDGRMKLIFHYGDEYKHYPNNGTPFILPKYFLIGQLTKPYEVEPTGLTGTFFVCFHPSGFFPFSDVSLKSIENTAVPLEILFGDDGLEIGQKILNVKTTNERMVLIEAFLTNQLIHKATINKIIESTVDTIFSANGNVSIGKVSKENSLNRRQLSRHFSKAIGLSPKQLAKTIRLQTALKAMLTDESTSLTQMAYKSEYYDQAHFIRDFKEFTGITPKEFYGDHLKMSLIFDTKD